MKKLLAALLLCSGVAFSQDSTLIRTAGTVRIKVKPDSTNIYNNLWIRKPTATTFTLQTTGNTNAEVMLKRLESGGSFNTTWTMYVPASSKSWILFNGAAVITADSGGDVTIADDLTVTGRISDNQFIDIRNYSVVGDGSTNDSAALALAISEAASKNQLLVIRPLANGNKTFLTGQQTISSRVEIRFEDGAILKQRNALSTAARAAVIKFAAGSAGSILDGAIIDGNRAVVKPAHIAAASSVEWAGVLIRDSNITIRNTEFRNITTTAVLADSQDQAKKNLTVENVLIRNSGSAILAKNTDNIRLSNLVMEGIHNDSVKIYQHGIDIWGSKNIQVDGLRMTDCGGDIRGLSSQAWSAVTIMQCDGRIDNVVLRGAVMDSLFSLGMTLATSSITASNWQIYGYQWPVELQAMYEMQLDNFSIDGQYVRRFDGNPTYGLTLSQNGFWWNQPGGENSWYHTIALNRNVKISNGTIKRMGYGVRFGSPNVTFENVNVVGCERDGILLTEMPQATDFVQANPDSLMSNIQFVNMGVKYNGGAGVRLEKGSNVSFQGGFYQNNGQSSSFSNAVRGGIVDTSVSGNVIGRVTLSGVNTSDIQNGTLGSDASINYSVFTGSYASGDTFSFTVNTPSQYFENQRLTVGTIPAKIVDVYLDSVRAVTTNSGTYPTSLVSGSGTISNSGATITGSSTDLDGEVTFRAWVKADGMFRRWASTRSATSGISEIAYSPALSADTFQIVKLDVVFDTTQHYGINIQQATNVATSNIESEGNMTANLQITNQNTFLRGRVLVGLNSALTFTDILTDATNKNVRLAGGHYTIGEEPVGLIYLGTTSANSTLNYGGGTGLLNAATFHRWFTAANNTTTTGTETMTLSNTGLGLGTTAPRGKLSIAGTTTTPTFNITNSSTNFTQSSIAQETDTSSFNVQWTATGKPILKMVGPSGNNFFSVDSTLSLDVSAVVSDTNSFTTTGTADTVLIAGASTADRYFLSYRATPNANDVLWFYTAKTDTVIFTRASSGTSGIGYAWLRIR